MIQYSLEVAICWAVLYLIYIIFLRKETFFSINRWYLMCSLFMGLIIPILKAIPDIWQEEVAVVHEALYFISAGPELIATNITPEQTEAYSLLNLNNILFSIYILGVLFVSSRFTIGLLNIRSLYTTGKKTKNENFTLVETTKFHLPFSFLNCVYFSKLLPVNKNIEKILKHELTHIKAWHTLDVLFIELLQVVFWFNPLIILYKKAIKESHEYHADANVLKETSQKIYGQILLRQSQSGLQIALANHFFHSHIKKRITMMSQKKSKWPAMFKYIFTLPVILLLMLLFQSQDIPETNTDDFLTAETFKTQILEEFNNGSSFTDINKIIDVHFESEHVTGSEMDKVLEDLYHEYHINISIEYDEDQLTKKCLLDNGPEHQERMLNYKKLQIERELKQLSVSHRIRNSTMEHNNMGIHDKAFTVVEKMPHFPGCDEILGSNKDRVECSNKRLREFINANLEYPEDVLSKKIYGMNVGQFIVEPDGRITELNLVRNIGGGTGKATMNLLRKMQKDYVWIPGYQNGVAVRVLYTLPIKFSIEEEESKSDQEITIAPNDEIINGTTKAERRLILSSASAPNLIELNYITEKEGQVNIFVHNMSGQLIYSKDKNVRQGQNFERLKINNGQAGMHVVTVIQESSRVNGKVILNN